MNEQYYVVKYLNFNFYLLMEPKADKKFQVCKLEEATPMIQSEAEKVLDEVSVNSNGTLNTDFIMVPVKTELVRKVISLEE
jgi:hypothetical protein